MRNAIKRLLVSASAFTLMLVPGALVAAPAFAQTADIDGNLCAGANLQVGDKDCSTAGDPAEKVNTLIAQVINIFSLVVGVVSVIMIIIGGLKYITSGGDAGNVSGAKNTILYAVIGLVVVALAQVIVRFVLDRTAQ